jgi:hypothetical protein
VNPGPGDIKTGSAERLDRGVSPGPDHGFTVSKSGRDSLRRNGCTAKRHLSPAAMGTNLHLGSGRNLNHAFPEVSVLAMFHPVFMIPGPSHV